VAKNRQTPSYVTDEVRRAWHDCNFHRLHELFDLTPWHHSPLPTEIDGLGVDQGPHPDYYDERQAHDWRRAQELQRQLLAACGWPKNCRKVYRANLAESLQWLRYCRSLVEHPERGAAKGSTGADPESRRQALREALDDAAYRRRLLDELDEKAAS
jgi:hypothetical protein